MVFKRGNKLGHKHGYSHNDEFSRTYGAWKNMRNRCNNIKGQDYHNYGGRGIKVCERWDDFNNFLSDMGQVPVNMSLDRINNDKGYSKNNCRWATRREQNLNQRARGVSKYRGVLWHKQNKKWVASVSIKRSHKYLGQFNNEIDAAKAFNNYVVENNLPNELNLI